MRYSNKEPTLDDLFSKHLENRLSRWVRHIGDSVGVRIFLFSILVDWRHVICFLNEKALNTLFTGCQFLSFECYSFAKAFDASNHERRSINKTLKALSSKCCKALHFALRITQFFLRNTLSHSYIISIRRGPGFVDFYPILYALQLWALIFIVRSWLERVSLFINKEWITLSHATSKAYVFADLFCSFRINWMEDEGGEHFLEYPTVFWIIECFYPELYLSPSAVNYYWLFCITLAVSVFYKCAILLTYQHNVGKTGLYVLSLDCVTSRVFAATSLHACLLGTRGLHSSLTSS